MHKKNVDVQPVTTGSYDEQNKIFDDIYYYSLNDF